MKTLFALLLAPTLGMAQNLDVTVTGYPTDTGTTWVSLYDSQAAFNGKGQPVAASRVKPHDGQSHLSFHGLPEGQYAIKLFHDANDNGKLDTNLIGIPTEPYGFSGKPGGHGPAQFEDAAFAVEGDTQITIKLR